MTRTPNRLFPTMTISYQELAKISKLERQSPKTAKFPFTPQLHSLLEASAEPTSRNPGANGQRAQHPSSLHRHNQRVRCLQLQVRRQTPHRRCPCGSLLDSWTWVIAAVHLPSQLRCRSRQKSRRTSQRRWRCDCTTYYSLAPGMLASNARRESASRDLPKDCFFGTYVSACAARSLDTNIRHNSQLCTPTPRQDTASACLVSAGVHRGPAAVLDRFVGGWNGRDLLGSRTPLQQIRRRRRHVQGRGALVRQCVRSRQCRAQPGRDYVETAMPTVVVVKSMPERLRPAGEAERIILDVCPSVGTNIMAAYMQLVDVLFITRWRAPCIHMPPPRPL
ncbi:hypothetical protein BDY17DRAFT_75953 [Neohortaea acidophila]|uniref:Uncharacterized protein n=1 Tax=Neohortaea acidophila TaxID=245834 RepID=A0A6A6Q2U3_9PEZI|nr:uncharacterized protein BDY17DRAFT_75953 [Neohortaea acidophila]KAF2486351.1 hypothetical protein BDY17DRAFT_75953 [Neohortaea acidophila]